MHVESNLGYLEVLLRADERELKDGRLEHAAVTKLGRGKVKHGTGIDAHVVQRIEGVVEERVNKADILFRAFALEMFEIGLQKKITLNMRSFREILQFRCVL